MQNLDQQWRELQARYEQMSDEELQDLASEACELTDMAKELLQSEIARRSVKIKLLAEPPAEDEVAPQIVDDNDFDPEDLDLVKMTPVWDMEDARRVKGILDGYGVPSYYGPDNAEDVETLSPAFGAAEAVLVGFGRDFYLDAEIIGDHAAPFRRLQWANHCHRCRIIDRDDFLLDEKKDSSL